MADVYAGLTPDFATKLKALIAACADQGIVMEPYFGLRDPITQAKLWRRSRSSGEIATQIGHLRAAGANFLADCLDKAGPQLSGPWATNALPGFSWHQYGEAVDCAWIRNGVMCWSTTLDGPKNGYLVYDDLAARQGLTAIAKTMHRDYGHVQLRPQGAPDQLYGILQIDTMMREKFGQAGMSGQVMKTVTSSSPGKSKVLPSAKVTLGSNNAAVSKTEIAPSESNGSNALKPLKEPST